MSHIWASRFDDYLRPEPLYRRRAGLGIVEMKACSSVLLATLAGLMR